MAWRLINSNGITIKSQTMKSKYFFVGMHNKPSMTPLDSRTRTGKVIDEIIKGLPSESIKTNLCEVEYLPKDIAEIEKFSELWHEKYKPQKGDVIILLGRWVNDNFKHKDQKTISLTHPAGIFGTKSKYEYIKNAVGSIILLSEI